MHSHPISSRPHVLAAVFGVLCLSVLPLRAQAESTESSATIPVILTNTLKAGKSNAGATFTAKTLEPIRLADNLIAPAGSTVEGHVLASRALDRTEAIGAPQNSSVLALHIDDIALDGKKFAIDVSLRAMASVLDSSDASNQRYLDEYDPVGYRLQIGGDHFSPFDKFVFSSDGEIVGYTRKSEVYARLFPNDYNNGRAVLHCDGSATEQPVSIFSADACGLYGFESIYLSGSGANGAITLESRRETVALHRGTTALLEVNRK